MVLSAPFVQDAYYIPFDPDFYFSDLYLEVRDPSTSDTLINSPFYLIKEGYEVEASVPRHPVLTTSGDELHLGQAPPHWFGEFANSETEVSIEPAVYNYAPLFLNQGADRQPYDEVPYTLYQDGSATASGNLPAASDYWDWMDPVVIPLSSAGRYSLEITYDQYWVNSQPGQARVVADFDTTQADKDPPTLLTLNVFYNGETASLVPPSAASEVCFRVQDSGGLSQVSLFYRDDSDWTLVALTSAGDDYTAELPGFVDGTYVSLKIMAEDTTGNSLTYEAVPAFEVAVPSPAPLSPPNGWVTQDHDITLAWDAVSGATIYRIQIDAVETFDSPSLIEDTVSDTSYTATLSLGTWYWHVLAIDGAGNESAYSPTWRFTIAEPVVQVTTDTGSDYDPSIVQATDGTLWVVWYSRRSGNGDIWYKTSSDGGATWSAAAQLTTNTNSDYDPAIAQAADGTLWVVWYSYRSGNTDIWYKTSSDSGVTWSASTQLTTDTGSDYDPAIAQATDGTLWVVWRSYRSGNSDIWGKYSTDDGATWSAAVQLTTDPNSDYAPAIVRTSDNGLWLVWYSYRTHPSHVWYMTSADNGATWSPPAALSDGSSYAYDPTIAQTPDGTLWAGWHSYGPWDPYAYYSLNTDLWAMQSTDGGATWSAPARFTRFTGYDEQPSFASGPGGNLAVAWQSDRATNYDVWFGVMGQREDVNPPPHIDEAVHDPAPNPDNTQTMTIRALLSDDDGISSAAVIWTRDGAAQGDLTLYDDGAHNDYAAGDGWYGTQLGPFPAGTVVDYHLWLQDTSGNVVEGEPTNWRYPTYFVVQPQFVPTASLLLVADERNRDTVYFSTFYADALEGLAYQYDLWNTYVRGVPDSTTLAHYDVVIWAMADYGMLLSWPERDAAVANLQGYLDGGGNLFISGQRVGDLDWYGTTPQAFHQNYLHAQSVRSSVGIYDLVGEVGDPIGDGLTLGISGGDGANNQWRQFEIDPLPPAQTVFKYQGLSAAHVERPQPPAHSDRPEERMPPEGRSEPWQFEKGWQLEELLPGVGLEQPQGTAASGSAAVWVDTGTYKLVYFAFGFEAINSAGDRLTVMERVLNLLIDGTPPPDIYDARTTNVRDISFTVSWLTNVEASGEVHYGTDPASLDQVAYDDRGAGTNDDTHYVTLQDLTPETTYYFDVVSAPTTDDNHGAHYSVTTGPTLGLPGSDTIWGQVFKYQVAYIYKDDMATAMSYENLLEGHSMVVDLLPMTVVSNPGILSPYQLIVVGPDTGHLSSWGDSASVNNIAQSGKPVIGLGEGGYALFGRLSLDIGSPYGWHGNENRIRVVTPTHPIYNTPHPIPVSPTDSVLTIYTSTPHVGIYLPTPPEDVTLLGREPDNQDHYPLIQQTSDYLLWGFNSGPSAMTEIGQQLFINTAWYMCDATTPAEGSIVYITLRDTDGSGSPNEAAPLSALVDNTGYWNTNLGNARTADLNAYFTYSASGDQVRLEAQGAADGTGCLLADTADDSPAADLILNVSTCSTEVEIPVQVGWNHVSLPLEPLTPYTAEIVCDEIERQCGVGVAAEIDRWYAGGWDGHICGLPFNDFDIQPGKDYFIRSNSACTWLIEGYCVTTPVPLDLQAGWNSIGVPHTDEYTAESLCNDINDQCGDDTAIEMDRWYAGGWDGHICGLPFNDFPIERGIGYFVKAASACTMTPSLPATPCTAARSLTMPRFRYASGYSTQGLAHAPWAAGKVKAAIAEVKVTNIRDTSFTVSWSTDVIAPGWVNHGASAVFGQTAYDDRGVNAVGKNHHVTIRGLSPQTTYYFEVVSGATVDDHEDSYYQAITGPMLELPASDSIYGRVFEEDGLTPAEGVIVYVVLRDTDGVGDPGEAGVMSALVDSEGWWHANLGNARLADGSNVFAYSAAGDVVTLAAQSAGVGLVTQTIDTGDLRPAAPLISRPTISKPISR